MTIMTTKARRDAIPLALEKLEELNSFAEANNINFSQVLKDALEQMYQGQSVKTRSNPQNTLL